MSCAPTKYVLVTGGSLSGIGKGIVASSTGVLMQSLGLTVAALKIDPYLNLDAGTMAPFEHGEVYVLDDGGEVDLDLGNYERFLNIRLTRDHNLTTGKIYHHVISKERRGDYLGKTVQVVPHVTNAIQEWIERVARLPVNADGRAPDVCIIELGGTVGDIEHGPFVEAMRQFQFRVGRDNFASIHVCLVPVIGTEQKTKPTQQSVQQLRALGIMPDVIVARCTKPVAADIKAKISMFCHVEPSAVVGCHDVTNTYAVPLLLFEQNLQELLLKKFALMGANVPRSWLAPRLEGWRNMAARMDRVLSAEAAAKAVEKGRTLVASADAIPLTPVRIAIVGKYTGLSDAYLSVLKSLQHGSLDLERVLKVLWIESTSLEPGAEGGHDAWELLRSADGILVPGGFGDRGVEGKILAAKFAREHKKPYLGICLGMQLAVVEFCRHVMGWQDANSAEFRAGASGADSCGAASASAASAASASAASASAVSSTDGAAAAGDQQHRDVVVFMPEVDRETLGGTMRLGARRTVFHIADREHPPAIWTLYGRVDHVDERHRHRYEVEPSIVAELEAKGLKFVGRDETGHRMEIVELADHPYYVGTQFHPEFLSRPSKPSPPFVGLLLAATGQLQGRLSRKH